MSTARILIADDKPETIDLYRQLLSSLNPGWQFFSAVSGDAGKTIVKSQSDMNQPIDVLLTDLRMEDDTAGLRLLKEAREIDQSIVAILLTGYGEERIREAVFDDGAFDYLDKPVPPVILNLKVRAALRYRDSLVRAQFLSRYFDPTVFEAIQKDPSILKMHAKVLSVCFWDIRGFSRLCESLKTKPELIAGFLREYFEIGAARIFRNGGIVDKFIGDGIMALFGVLGDRDENAEAIRAVTAAMEFREDFSHLLGDWSEKWSLLVPERINIGLGCGIHTAEVLVGNVGTEKRDQFTALGTQVNLAARIQSRAESGQILISRITSKRVASSVSSAPAGELTDLKNISGTFPLFAVEKVVGL